MPEYENIRELGTVSIETKASEIPNGEVEILQHLFVGAHENGLPYGDSRKVRLSKEEIHAIHDEFVEPEVGNMSREIIRFRGDKDQLYTYLWERRDEVRKLSLSSEEVDKEINRKWLESNDPDSLLILIRSIASVAYAEIHERFKEDE